MRKKTNYTTLNTNIPIVLVSFRENDNAHLVAMIYWSLLIQKKKNRKENRKQQ